jgi:hypothetical protein
MQIQNLRVNGTAGLRAVPFAKKTEAVAFRNPMAAFDHQFCTKPLLEEKEERKLGKQLSDINSRILALVTRVGKHRLDACIDRSQDSETNIFVVTQTIVNEIQKGNYGAKLQRRLKTLLDQRRLIQTTFAEHNGRLIIFIAKAKKFAAGLDIQLADLCSAGLLGLSRACERYDIAKAKFAKVSNYATWYIRKEIQETIKEYRNNIPASELAIEAGFIYSKYNSEEQSDKNRVLRNTELRAVGAMDKNDQTLFRNKHISTLQINRSQPVGTLLEILCQENQRAKMKMRKLWIGSLKF